MMTFFIQGPSSQKLMPMVNLFGQHTIAKADHTEPGHPVKDMGHYTTTDARTKKISHSGIAVQSYHNIEQLPQNSTQLIASQIMSPHVITLKQNNLITDAIKLFKTKKIRHAPITTKDGTVEGMLSESDVLHYLSGVNDDYTKQKSPAKTNDKVSRIMKHEVLTASADTDVRYIARLFVEQHVGAMPIVNDGKVIGIITRSDVLAAVMRHFILELWV